MKLFTVKRNSLGEYEVHVEDGIRDLIITMIKAGHEANEAAMNEAAMEEARKLE